MRTLASRFADGLSAPWRGLSLLLSRRRLMLLALAPAAISAIVFIGGVIWGIENLRRVTAEAFAFVGHRPPEGDPLWFLAFILIWPAFLAGLAFASFLGARLLAAPFNSLIAEIALRAFGGQVDGAQGAFAWSGRFARMALVSVAQEMLLIGAGLALFVASLFPFLSLAAAATYFLLAAFDGVSYALDVKGTGLRARIAYFRRHFPAYAGFAFSLAAVVAVPVLNLFALPIAVAGGAWLVVRLGNPVN